MPDAAGPPPCRSLGQQCRELAVVLRVADLADDTKTEQDALATWLLGHTERLRFGEPFRRDGRLLVEAVITVECKYLKRAGDRGGAGDRVRCQAHGYEGPAPIVPTRKVPPSFWADSDRALVVQDGKLQHVGLR
ncbi:MAG TPA: hypothetical protein VNL18_09155, partial [Gemmatimonadales bacterium]|nr:hypothetical protein [Gemmatimonadales bacterium]